ncbi:acyltransferase family protein [Agrobacterium cavarae]|uniref:acyltransferase family protein n=1 Tax=Agrobacterium cavarae TaxID=2528239 RepID=UPI0028B2566B|nr:acyltransferase [Agrobacterium cavarae]
MKRPEELHSLTGIRGVAALMVILLHADFAAVRMAGGTISDVIFRGGLFVDVFFVLSGFILSHVYLTGRRGDEPFDWANFFLARFARIYPLHIATAFLSALGLVIVAMLKNDVIPIEINLMQAVRELTLTQAMPLLGSDEIWNSPSWSISVEFWTYFTVFPILLWLTPRTSVKQTVLLSAVILIIFVCFFPFIGTAARGWPAFCRAASEFTAGWAAWRVWNAGVKVTDWQVDVAFVTMFALTQIGPHIWDPLQFTAVLLVPYILVGLVSSQSIARRVSEHPIVMFLGAISFSMYLWHPLVLKILQVIAAKFPFLVGNVSVFVVATLTFTIPLSWASYIFF